MSARTRWPAVLATLVLVATLSATPVAAGLSIEVVEKDLTAGSDGAFDFTVLLNTSGDDRPDGRLTAAVDGSAVWTSTINSEREPRHVKVDGRHGTLAPGEHTIRVNVSLTTGGEATAAWRVEVVNETATPTATPTPTATASDRGGGGGGIYAAGSDAPGPFGWDVYGGGAAIVGGTYALGRWKG